MRLSIDTNAVLKVKTLGCEYNGEIKISDEHSALKWVHPEGAIEKFEFERQKEAIIKYMAIF